METLKEDIIEEENEQEDITNEIQLVSFKLEDEEFGIPIEDVQEIIRMKEITKIPGTRTFVEGVIDLRGQILPIINLRKKLNLEEQEFNASTRIVVIAVDSIKTGIIVDNVSEVLRVSKNSVKKPPALLGEDTQYITGIVRFDSRLIILLNVKSIITKEDIVHLSEITKKITSKEKVKQDNTDNIENIEKVEDVKMCKGINPDGTKCTRFAMKGSDYCEIHQPE